MTTQIAALYVHRGGSYFGLDGVDPWDEARDARLYTGPHPVVAHPPCARWCRLAKQIEKRGGARVGDDGGTFAAALAAVRAWGGVLEHPAFSLAWAAHGLIAPPAGGGWAVADWRGGWTCRVDQSWYGHRAQKSTWLYAVGSWLPSLRWERREGEITVTTSRRINGHRHEMKNKSERAATPPAFRDILIEIARRARAER